MKKLVNLLVVFAVVGTAASAFAEKLPCNNQSKALIGANTNPPMVRGSSLFIENAKYVKGTK